MTGLTQQAFDRISEIAKNAIKERDVAREALRKLRGYFGQNRTHADLYISMIDEALNFRADGDA